jgi:hypothetical protein
MDATRFLRLHWNTIRQNPLQVYHIFAISPLSSIFQRLYAKSTSFPHPIVTMGVEQDWPSTMIVQTYDIQTSILLPPDDAFCTGGQREGRPVFSTWDVKTVDGVTSIHPCGTQHCAVSHLSFTQSSDGLVLRTGCNCGKLCKWKVMAYSHSLLGQTTIESDGICVVWADDATKAITFSMDKHIANEGKKRPKYYCNTIVDGSSPIRHQIFENQKEDEGEDERTDRNTRIQFSPGQGERFFRWISSFSEDKISVFESSSGILAIQKSYPQGLKEVQFSPDGKNILLWFGLSQCIKYISSENGIDLWDWSLENGFIKNIQFFPSSAQILLLSTSATYVIDSLNGSTLYKRDTSDLVFPCCSFLSPDGDRIAIHSSGTIKILDYTLDRYISNHFVEEKDHILHFSWRHSALISMQDHYDGRASVSFQQLSSNSITVNSTRDPNLYVSKAFLSPDGYHLVTMHEDGSFCLWDTASGNKMPIIDNEGDEPFRNYQLQYTQDSSAALIWCPERLLLLGTKTGDIRTMPLPATNTQTRSSSSPALPLLACSFFPTSRNILTIHSDGCSTKLSLDDSTPLVLCRLPSPPGPIHQLLISPKEQCAVLICERNLMILSFADGVRLNPLGPSKYSGAGFSPDGSSLCVLESSVYLNTVFVIWCVNVSNWVIRKCHIQIQPAWYWPKLRSVSNSMCGGRSLLNTLTSQSSPKGLTSCSFDCSNGKQIIPPSICRDDERLRYGTHSLMKPHFSNDSISCITENHVAYIENGRVVVVDYSLLISKM